MEAGVETVMTTEPTWAGPEWPAWRIPRVQLHGNDVQQHALKLFAARFGHLLSNPDGTGRTYVRINRLARRVTARRPAPSLSKTTA